MKVQLRRIVIPMLMAAAFANGDELDQYHADKTSRSKNYLNYLEGALQTLKNDGQSNDWLNQVISEAVSDKNQEYNFLRQYDNYISFTENSEGDPVLGLYYSERLRGHAPYVNFFEFHNQSAESLPLIKGDLLKIYKTIGDCEVSLFTALNLKIMELEDVYMPSEDLRYLARFRTIHKLGLPSRGVNFDAGFAFPPNLNTLIVRNAVLNERFFHALNDLKNLKELIIVNCATDLPEVRMNHFDLIDKQGTRDKVARPFNAISQTVESLKLRRSHPLIFDYIVTENWTSLKFLRVDIYSTARGFTTFVHPTDGKSPFPILEQAFIGVSNHYKVQARDILLKGVKKFPDIAEKVQFTNMDKP